MKILLAVDDFQAIANKINQISDNNLHIDRVTDLESAIKKTEEASQFLEPYDLIVLDLNISAGNFNPYRAKYYLENGLNYLYIIRNIIKLSTPIVILIPNKNDFIENIAINFNVLKIIILNMLSENDIFNIIVDSIQYANKISISRAVVENDPLPIGELTMENTLHRLHNPDKQVKNLGFQYAKSIGGKKIVSAIAQLILDSINNNDLETYEDAIDTISVIYKRNLYNYPSFNNNLNNTKINLESINANNSNIYIGMNTKNIINHNLLIFSIVIQEMRNQLSQHSNIDEVNKNTILNDLNEFENKTISNNIENNEAVNILTRIKQNAPWLKNHFLTLTEGALAHAFGIGIVEAIKTVWGG